MQHHQTVVNRQTFKVIRVLRGAISTTLGAMLLTSLVPSSAVAISGQKTIPALQVAQMINGTFTDAKIRLNNVDLNGYGRYLKDDWYKPNDSYFQFMGKKQPIALQHWTGRREKGYMRWYYYINNVNTEAVTLRHESNRYVFRAFFESSDREIKGLCRWKKAVGKNKGKYTQCKPSGNDRPAPDGDFNHAKVQIALKPIVRNGGIVLTIPQRNDVKIGGDLQIQGVLGWFNRIEDAVENYGKRKVGDAIFHAFQDPQRQTTMQQRTAQAIRRLNAFSGFINVRPVRFKPNGDLVVAYNIKVDKSLVSTALKQVQHPRQGKACKGTMDLMATFKSRYPAKLTYQFEGENGALSQKQTLALASKTPKTITLKRRTGGPGTTKHMVQLPRRGKRLKVSGKSRAHWSFVIDGQSVSGKTPWQPYAIYCPVPQQSPAQLRELQS